MEGIVSNRHWKIFVDSGDCELLVLKRIAIKVATQETLTNREEAIRQAKSKQIEHLLLSLWKR
jgi:hypothetical protein